MNLSDPRVTPEAVLRELHAFMEKAGKQNPFESAMAVQEVTHALTSSDDLDKLVDSLAVIVDRASEERGLSGAMLAVRVVVAQHLLVGIQLGIALVEQSQLAELAKK